MMVNGWLNDPAGLLVTVTVTFREPTRFGRIRKLTVDGPVPDVLLRNWIIPAVPPVTPTDQAQLPAVLIEMLPEPPALVNDGGVGDIVAP